jgi:hypothetical protein
MSLFTSTAMYQQQSPSGGGGGVSYQWRNDPYSSSLVLALPMSQFSTLGMTSYRQDVSALIKGTGSNVSLGVTGSVFPSGSTNNYGGGDWAAEGYTSSGAIVQTGGSSYGSPSTTVVNFASSNFVIEAYIQLQDAGQLYNSTVFGQNSGDYLLADISTNSNSIRFYIAGSGGVVGTGAWNAGVWYHVAYVRSGNNYYSYLNGTRRNNFSRSGAVPNSPDGLWRLLGYGGNANESVAKTTQDFRLYIGTDKGYTGATITPPQSMVQKIVS